MKQKKHKHTVVEYFSMLLKLVPEEHKKESIKNRLYDLKQGEYFNDFLIKFQRLELQLKSKDAEWKDIDTVFAFKRAVKPKVRFELEKNDIKSYC